MKKYTWPNSYAVCPCCGRGVGISVNGILRKHGKGRAANETCPKSGKHFRSIKKHVAKPATLKQVMEAWNITPAQMKKIKKLLK